MPELPLDQVLAGDCIKIMGELPEESIDLVFADPPYNLQLSQELWRPNRTRVDAVNQDWDQFSSFKAYDDFTAAWLSACRRVLKRTGTLWVIGTYHNIFRIGRILQDLDFWILNDVIWIKDNPMPNFRGVRLTNAHETLIWAQKERGAAYTFNHHALKSLNDEKQMRSDWYLPTCRGKERLRENGSKAHPTQKPEGLLYRVLTACSDPGEVVLDPFFGSGTSGVVAKKLYRHFIGIEKDKTYLRAARRRIDTTQPAPEGAIQAARNPRKEKRIPIGALLENGLLKPGQSLRFGGEDGEEARLMADGRLEYNDRCGSIHAIARQLQSGAVNGWTAWHYRDTETGNYQPLDTLRQQYRAQFISSQKEPIHE